ncbi:MAG TPA: RusA family crossover junction endodeoxyribonuclease [Modicisalibacter sp.]|nr:RusA family crossover junction endodeoxyribonuclease [Modicisalibacter sp.]
MIITLPFPPSTNTVWRNLKGRTLLSRKGREYRKAVIALVAEQKAVAGLAGRLSVTVMLHPPDRRKRDIDNYGGKALLDAITHAGVWIDDEQIDRLEMIRGEIRKPGMAVVTITECGVAA